MTIRPRVPRRQLARIFGAGAATALLATGLSAAPAAAGQSICQNFGDRAKICFYHHGEHVRVWDLKSDGYKVHGLWEGEGGSGRCRIDPGENYKHCDNAQPEGTTFNIQLLLINVNDSGDKHLSASAVGVA